jgi:hypothetical protein
MGCVEGRDLLREWLKGSGGVRLEGFEEGRAREIEEDGASASGALSAVDGVGLWGRKQSALCSRSCRKRRKGKCKKRTSMVIRILLPVVAFVWKTDGSHILTTSAVLPSRLSIPFSNSNRSAPAPSFSYSAQKVAGAGAEPKAMLRMPTIARLSFSGVGVAFRLEEDE